MEKPEEIRPFLKDVAEDMLARFGHNLSSHCVVFPNKRARLFFSHYLAESSGGKPVWAPQYKTISELIQDLSGSVLADRLQLIFELYAVFIKITGSNENPDDFFFYGEMLLSDFDDIDKNLANARDIFKNLSELKSIEGHLDYLSENQLHAILQFWKTFDSTKASRDQNYFLVFWDRLAAIYDTYRLRLKEKKLAYEGMIYREAAEKIKSGSILNFASEQYIFTGFNALNKCEEVLFRHLKNSGKALFYWDYDEYYTNSSIHEAGYFVRENIKMFPSARLSDNCRNLAVHPKNITLLPVSSNMAQVKAIPAIFEKMGLGSHSELGQTALVLSDEKLLLPVLYSLPDTLWDSNITMGYPLRESTVFAFIEQLSDLHKHTRLLDHGSNYALLSEDVLNLLKHPFVYSGHRESAGKLTAAVLEKRKVLVPLSVLQEYDDLKLFFQHLQHREDTVAYFIKILEHIIRNITNAEDTGENKLQIEFLYHAYTCMIRLSEVVSKSETDISPNLLFRMIRKVLGTITVPFSGEPLSGLQVLGILETRLLDFRNVILLSANEGIIPRSSRLASFIPGNLRFGFGLSLPEHQDAIYAYYFYRLIQRAENIFIVYNNSAEGLLTGEPSRFIHQLVYEKPFNVKEMNLDIRVKAMPAKPIIIQKGTRALEKINSYLGEESGSWLSPSAFNEYINCPLRYYFHHVESLKETEEISEEVDPLIFGNLVHRTMHQLYKPFVGKEINSGVLDELKKNESYIEEEVLKALNRELYGAGAKQENEITGMNLIIKEIVKKYIRQILTFDKKNNPFTIISLEEKYSTGIKIRLKDTTCFLKVGGIVDRIDRLREGVRIIDYKTGISNLQFNGIDSLFTDKPSKRNDAAFQVFLYALIYADRMKEGPIIPCLLYLRESYNPDFHLLLKDKSQKNAEVRDFSVYNQPFSDKLQTALERFVDPAESFTQTDDLTYCRHCPYRKICHR